MLAPPDGDVPEPSQQTDSLLKRLAGPSVTKAGLAKDQSEINRIIAEASKGSKFYENEKRKDKELTEKIARILRHRDEVLKGVDLRGAEHSIDHLLFKLEAQRDLTQIIVHVDMDAFYANVEILHDPSLKGKPFAVGGKGILTTASYEARKFGARSGMSTFIAKKLCPDLILVPTHFDRYMEMSNKVMDIFRRYDPNMSAAGCDEGYLNITAYCEEHGVDAEECVRGMRETVHKETKLTVSAGIAPNKMLAKICSDKNKPNGQFRLDFSPCTVKAFMYDLPIRKVPGVGRVNERLLDSMGVKTCGDIYTHRAVLSLMDRHFDLDFLLRTYLGIASNVVQPGRREERKSIGAERTFTSISDQDRIFQKLEEVAAELESDMTSGGWTGKTVTLKYKLDTYQVFTRAKSFDRWILGKKEELFSIGKELLMPEFPLTLRLIGLRVTKLKDLRAEGKSVGIMKFFGAVDSAGSPNKKRRIATELHEDDRLDDSISRFHEKMRNESDEEESQMMHFDEVVHREPAIDVDVLEEESLPGQHHGHRPRPPNSAPALTPSPLTSKPMSAGPSNPRTLRAASSGPSAGGRMSPRPPPGHKDESDMQTCPVCSKAMRATNDELNAHIDFCLSKEAIREARAAAFASTPAPTSKGFKPKSVMDLSWAKKRNGSPSKEGTVAKRKRKK